MKFRSSFLGQAGFLLLAFFSSCASQLSPVSEMSVTDSQYLLQASRQREKREDAPFVAGFYHAGFGKVLGTDCRWIPSDSEYAVLKYRQCGALTATVRAFARYTSEFDAYQIAKGVVNLENRIHFFDFDDSCALF
ncbi:MAG: hypothetical protein ACXVBE_07805 [Bdellovibrionota bacterium]